MEKKLILRGLLAGAVAGALAFIFARIFAEPAIDQAISYQTGRDAADVLFNFRLYLVAAQLILWAAIGLLRPAPEPAGSEPAPERAGV